MSGKTGKGTSFENEPVANVETIRLVRSPVPDRRIIVAGGACRRLTVGLTTSLTARRLATSLTAGLAARLTASTCRLTIGLTARLTARGLATSLTAGLTASLTARGLTAGLTASLTTWLACRRAARRVIRLASGLTDAIAGLLCLAFVLFGVDGDGCNQHQ